VEKLGEVTIENGSAVSVIGFGTVGFLGATFEMRSVGERSSSSRVGLGTALFGFVDRTFA
jgi:hypothetical protein